LNCFKPGLVQVTGEKRFRTGPGSLGRIGSDPDPEERAALDLQGRAPDGIGAGLRRGGRRAGGEEISKNASSRALGRRTIGD
jgi:hypothetical protein